MDVRKNLSFIVSLSIPVVILVVVAVAGMIPSKNTLPPRISTSSWSSSLPSSPSLTDASSAMSFIDRAASSMISKVPSSSSVPVAPAWLFFKSVHGFSWSYPPPWSLESTINRFSTIAEAQRSGGNHFTVYSYDPAQRDGGPWQKDDMKIEVWIYDRSAPPSGDAIPDTAQEWAQSQSHLVRSSSLTLGPLPAIEAVVLLSYGEDVVPDEEIHYIYALRNDRAVRFTLYPSNPTPTQLRMFRSVVKTFRFLGE